MRSLLFLNLRQRLLIALGALFAWGFIVFGASVVGGTGGVRFGAVLGGLIGGLLVGYLRRGRDPWAERRAIVAIALGWAGVPLAAGVIGDALTAVDRSLVTLPAFALQGWVAGLAGGLAGAAVEAVIRRVSMAEAARVALAFALSILGLFMVLRVSQVLFFDRTVVYVVVAGGLYALVVPLAAKEPAVASSSTERLSEGDATP